MTETPASRIEAITARYESGNGEAPALTAAALRRLEWRRDRGRKQCDHCQEAKPVGEFGRDMSRSDGLRRWCRSCINAAQAVRRER